jgi:hypothetical protein
MKKTATKGRRTPTKSLTPVIAGRVPESIHRQIKEAAKRSGRSMSDELAWRAGVSFEWEKSFGEARKLLADAQRAAEGDLRQAMRSAGLTLVHGSAGDYWMEPGTPPLKIVLDPELRAAIIDAVKQGLAQAKEGSQ